MDNKVLTRLCQKQNLLYVDNDFIIATNPNVKHLERKVQLSEAYIIMHCTKGSMEFSVNMKRSTITAGDVTYIMPGQIYELENISNDYKSTVLLMSESFLQWIDLDKRFFYWDRSGKPLQLSSSHIAFSNYIEMCRSIIINDPIPQKKEILYCLTQAYLLGLSHVMGFNSCDVIANDASALITNKFMNLLKEEGAIHHSVKYYSDILCISAKHLSFVLKQKTGYSASYWIIHAINLKAKQLLRSSDMSISQIACRLSFSSQSLFCSFFKKHVGTSPMEYRKNSSTL